MTVKHHQSLNELDKEKLAREPGRLRLGGKPRPFDIPSLPVAMTTNTTNTPATALIGINATTTTTVLIPRMSKVSVLGQ
jgi:hypothetical protein